MGRPLVKPPVWMTDLMREVLVDHVDGSLALSVHDQVRFNSIKGCVGRGLIRWDQHQHTCRPERTIITPKGREMLAVVLAYYAEVLAMAARHRDGVLIRLHMEKAGAEAARS